jgi:hypothetical protein
MNTIPADQDERTSTSASGTDQNAQAPAPAPGRPTISSQAAPTRDVAATQTPAAGDTRTGKGSASLSARASPRHFFPPNRCRTCDRIMPRVWAFCPHCGACQTPNEQPAEPDALETPKPAVFP